MTVVLQRPTGVGRETRITIGSQQGYLLVLARLNTTLSSDFGFPIRVLGRVGVENPVED